MNQSWLAADVHGLRGFQNGGPEVANPVDEVHSQRLLASPDEAIGNGLYIIDFGVAAIRHRLNKLTVHVVDQSLHVRAFFGSELAGGIAGVLELADFQQFRLELGPAHQVAVVDPLSNDANRTHHAAAIRIDLVGSRGDVVSAARANCLDRRDDVFLLLVANALDLAIDFFGRGHATAGRVHVDDDGLDRVVISQLAQLFHRFRGAEDDTVEIDDTDLIAEEARLLSTCMEGEKHQREHGQDKEEERSSSNQYPEPYARTSVVAHKFSVV